MLVDEFQAESAYCQKNNVNISNEMLGAFLDAMDLNGNGILEPEEIVGILKVKKGVGSGSNGMKKWEWIFDMIYVKIHNI